MTDLAEQRGVETEVYQPAEDSRLLAAAAAPVVEDGDLVVDVGTGSGFVAARVAVETGARVVATDLNPHACRQARERAVEAGVPIDVLRADLLGPLREGSVDVALFNPPYLPENEAAAREDWMEVALTGGETGREVTERFVEEVGRVLAPGGRAVVLVSSLGGIDEIEARATERGFAVDRLAEESYPFEVLAVLCLRGA